MTSNIGLNLAAWFQSLSPDDISSNGRTNYQTQFTNVAQYLEKNVHIDVEKGAAVHDAHEGMFLNAHDPEHIAAVIARASDILNAAHAEVSPYEAYLLLFAIHLHDTGNLFGRQDHEQRCRHIMKQLGTRAGEDDIEKRCIANIAAAHGGRTAEGGKDTISNLIPNPDVPLLGQRVRAQFLAALLRLADELADDRSRASTFALKVGAIPEASRIYHQYSQSLHSVLIGEREIALDFDFSEETAATYYPKAASPSRLLLDEIFERTIKMHLERMYCMRYLRPYIRLDEIRVHIEVFDNDYNQPLTELRYRLIEKGYPSGPNGGIHSLCPELAIWSGDLLLETLGKLHGPKQ